jgi:hypothetical protein
VRAGGGLNGKNSIGGWGHTQQRPQDSAVLWVCQLAESCKLDGWATSCFSGFSFFSFPQFFLLICSSDHVGLI